MKIVKSRKEFRIEYNEIDIISHSSRKPWIIAGTGIQEYEMNHGNFKIKEEIKNKYNPESFKIVEEDNETIIETLFENNITVTAKFKEINGRLNISFECSDKNINRFWLRIDAGESEKIYGCGEQFSYFNLRGKNFPIWTSEQGVGRNKRTLITKLADMSDNAGGDYYTTFYPQPTFVSTKKYYLHAETSYYADFNFRNKSYHELYFWEIPQNIIIENGNSFADITEKLTELLGRQPELPDWVYNGIILGIQGGKKVVDKKIKKALNEGMNIAGVWIQDWVGIRMTSFGKRLMWNWEAHKELYPDLKNYIKELNEKGIKFLGYINPYVAIEGNLYKEAKEKEYLAKNKSGEVYLVDFGEFYAGIVDFTNPDACVWYKQVIKNNLIDIGQSGWMADFGEYLPTDVVLFNGEPAEKMHNEWPAIWARINYEAVEEAGKLGEIVYFMRAGYTGSQKYSTLMWAGDQNVDWSLDDGLASVIPAALSSGMSGCGLHHSDIGGYTTLFTLKRSKTLLLRWAEFCVFTPFMRSHEGNRPLSNFQFDDDQDTLKKLSRLSKIFTELSSYAKEAVKENSEKGIPVMRPLFMHYENDEKSYDIKYEYLYGEDLLVAPLYKNKDNREVHLPDDEWVHLWTGKEYKGGDYKINSPIGYPPVFYRKKSRYIKLFEKIGKM